MIGTLRGAFLRFGTFRTRKERFRLKKHEKEMTNDGELKPMSKFEKFDVVVICPLMMVIVFLYVFGFIS